MTGWGSVEIAVDAMRHGARDFIQKPWDNERLLATLRKEIALSRSLRRRRQAVAVSGNWRRKMSAMSPLTLSPSVSVERVVASSVSSGSVMRYSVSPSFEPSRRPNEPSVETVVPCASV